MSSIVVKVSSGNHVLIMTCSDVVVVMVGCFLVEKLVVMIFFLWGSFQDFTYCCGVLPVGKIFILYCIR